MVSPFASVKVGDKLTRVLGGKVPMPVTVTAVTADRIVCGPWTFSRLNGAELDDFLGWTELTTGSQLRPPEVKSGTQ